MRASVSSRLLGVARRGATRRRRNRRSASPDFFADVTPGCKGGRCQRGNNQGDTAETATSLNYFAAIGLRRARMKTATGHARGATVSRRHLVGLFRASFLSLPRVVNSAEQITELGRLTRPLVRFLRDPWCLLRAIVRFRNSDNKGRSAWVAWSLNHIAATDLRAAWMEKYNRANITGNGTETALGSSVSSLWASSPAGQPSLPGSQPRPRRQRGARSTLSAYIVTSAGEITWAAPPKWRYVQTFGPRRVLPSCVVNSAGEITMATPRFWRLL